MLFSKKVVTLRPVSQHIVVGEEEFFIRTI